MQTRCHTVHMRHAHNRRVSYRSHALETSAGAWAKKPSHFYVKNMAIIQYIFRMVHLKAGLTRFGPVGCLTELPGTYFALHLFRI